MLEFRVKKKKEKRLNSPVSLSFSLSKFFYCEILSKFFYCEIPSDRTFGNNFSPVLQFPAFSPWQGITIDGGKQ